MSRQGAVGMPAESIIRFVMDLSMARPEARYPPPVYRMPSRSKVAWTRPSSPSWPWRPRNTMSEAAHSSSTLGPNSRPLWSFRLRFTASISGAVTSIFASGHKPSGASNSVSGSPGRVSRPRNRSTKIARCPFSRRARHTELPVTRETARSVDSPPAKTTIFIDVRSLPYPAKARCT